MAEIYRNAYCTIAVNIEESPNRQLWKGCGNTDDISDTHWVEDFLESQDFGFGHSPAWRGLLEGGPLGERAWCLQERQLSPRMFHFLDCGMMMWECCFGLSALGGPIIFGPPLSRPEMKPDDWQRIIDIKSISDDEGDDSDDSNGGSDDENGHSDNDDDSLTSQRIYPAETFLDVWYDGVADYSSRELTYETDRPVALQGIVTHISRMTGLNYFAGLWQEDIIRGLLWERQNTSLDSWSRSSTPAPSWSWQSIIGPVKGVAANDEELNPPLLLDTRRRRRIIDHSYNPLAQNVELDQQGLKIHVSGLTKPMAWTNHHQFLAYLGTRHIPIFCEIEDLFYSCDDTTPSVCLDMPDEEFQGNLVVLLLTNDYGLLLRQTERDNEFCRLGTVRIPPSWVLHEWENLTTNVLILS